MSGITTLSLLSSFHDLITLCRGVTLAFLLLIKVELQKPPPPLADTSSCIASEGSAELSLVRGLYLWHMNR